MHIINFYRIHPFQRVIDFPLGDLSIFLYETKIQLQKDSIVHLVLQQGLDKQTRGSVFSFCFINIHEIENVTLNINKWQSVNSLKPFYTCKMEVLVLFFNYSMFQMPLLITQNRLCGHKGNSSLFSKKIIIRILL